MEQSKETSMQKAKDFLNSLSESDRELLSSVFSSTVQTVKFKKMCHRK